MNKKLLSVIKSGLPALLLIVVASTWAQQKPSPFANLPQQDNSSAEWRPGAGGFNGNANPSAQTRTPAPTPRTPPYGKNVPPIDMSKLSVAFATQPFTLSRTCKPGTPLVILNVIIKNSGGDAVNPARHPVRLMARDSSKIAWTGGTRLPFISAGASQAVAIPMNPPFFISRTGGAHQFIVWLANTKTPTPITVNIPSALCDGLVKKYNAAVALANAKLSNAKLNTGPAAVNPKNPPPAPPGTPRTNTTAASNAFNSPGIPIGATTQSGNGSLGGGGAFKNTAGLTPSGITKHTTTVAPPTNGVVNRGGDNQVLMPTQMASLQPLHIRAVGREKNPGDRGFSIGDPMSRFVGWEVSEVGAIAIFRTAFWFDTTEFDHRNIRAARLKLRVVESVLTDSVDHHTSCVANIGVGVERWWQYEDWIDEKDVVQLGAHVGPDEALDVTSIVQRWAQNPDTNFGMVLKGNNENPTTNVFNACLTNYDLLFTRLEVEYN
jgi:hypothetical protein